MKKGARTRLHWFCMGIRYGYPPCCVLRFTFSRQDAQAVHRGGIMRRPYDETRGYVPCLVFHGPWNKHYVPWPNPDTVCNCCG